MPAMSGRIDFDSMFQALELFHEVGMQAVKSRGEKSQAARDKDFFFNCKESTASPTTDQSFVCRQLLVGSARMPMTEGPTTEQALSFDF
jgi:hypothetical protein